MEGAPVLDKFVPLPIQALEQTAELDSGTHFCLVSFHASKYAEGGWGRELGGGGERERCGRVLRGMRGVKASKGCKGCEECSALRRSKMLPELQVPGWIEAS